MQDLLQSIFGSGWRYRSVEFAVFLFVFGVYAAIRWAVTSSDLERWPTVVGSVQNRYVKPVIHADTGPFSPIPTPNQKYKAVIISYYAVNGEQYTNREEAEFESRDLAHKYTDRFPDSILIHYNPKRPEKSIVDAREQGKAISVRQRNQVT